MAKDESGICRICNEYEEPSGSLDSIYSFSNVVNDIKETLGIEILIGPDVPTYVCQECISSLENAQKFRQKCIRSNEFYALIVALSKDANETNSPEETKLFDSNLYQCGSKTPTMIGSAVTTELNIQCDDKVKSSNVEKRSDEDVAIPINDNTAHEHLTQSLMSINDPDSTSDNRKKKGVKRKDRFELAWKPKMDKSVAPIICDICGNVFKSKHVFSLHSRRHSNNKPYDCELCSSRFYTNSELKRHMRRHTGEKPYECQHCHRKFSDYGTLTKHIRTHTNDRPFPCKQCGKSFSCTFVLKNHMLIHTGERAFRCEVCDKSFGRLHNLTTHMKSFYHKRNVYIKQNQTEVS